MDTREIALQELRAAWLTRTGAPRLEALANYLRQLSGVDALLVSWLGESELGVSDSESSGNGWGDANLPISITRHGALIAGKAFELPLPISDPDQDRVPKELGMLLANRGAQSAIAFPLLSNGHVQGVAIGLQSRVCRRWYPWELGSLIAEAKLATQCVLVPEPSVTAEPLPLPAPARTPIGLSGSSGGKAVPVSEVVVTQQVAPPTAEKRQNPVADTSGLLVRFSASKSFALESLEGDVEALFGVSRSEVLSPNFQWEKYVPVRDFARLKSRAERRAKESRGFEFHLRILSAAAEGGRWLQLLVRPRLDQDGGFIGWDGVAVDSTARRKAELELMQERRRMRALYTVSSSLHGHLDPHVLGLTSLHSLTQATRASAGVVCLRGDGGNVLEIVASEGLDAALLDSFGNDATWQQSLLKALADEQAVHSQDLSLFTEAQQVAAKKAGIRSALLVPLAVDGQTHGVFVLFHRRNGRFSNSDLELARTAIRPVSLAIAQAELYSREQRQSASLSALYRLSHELSKQLTLREVAEQSFEVIRGELECKRGWFGVLNEQGTHIVGLAGFGSGVRRVVIERQIELKLRHDFIDEALRKREPIFVPANTPMECSGLNRVVEALKPSALLIIPLVALGQAVGLLILEPASAVLASQTEKRDLLKSLAAEIGTVLLARRFEGRLAEAGKMRMAGMLAAGVAHNFNNLLQAVMGQASLIEMQVPKDSSILSSTKMIVEAAHRGAQLVKQLLHFSTDGAKTIKPVSLNQVLEESETLYRSLIPATIQFRLRLCEEVVKAEIDYGQFQQVLSNLLVNAREAIGARSGGHIVVSVHAVRLLTGEVSPDLPPGEYIRIDVDDNGEGMDAEQQARCFEPFFTTKTPDARAGVAFGGIGLSLSSAYSIMRNHRGILTVSSTKGEGSVFSLYLPRVMGDSGALGPTTHAAAVGRFVAFCEFEASHAFALRTALRSLGIVSCALSPARMGVGDMLSLVKTECAGQVSGLLVVDIEGADGRSQQIKEFVEQSAIPYEVLLYRKVEGPIAPEWLSIPTATPIDAPLDVWRIASLVSPELERKQLGEGI